MISKDGIINKNTIMTHNIIWKDPMVKKHDEKMTGTGEWTKEEMKAMEKDHMMMSGADMKDDMMMKKDTMMKIDSYLPYDEKILTESLKSGKKVALFFHANWCPTCRNLDEHINKELSTIPADTMIFKVDYDDSDSLKQKYGVTSQSVTLVLNTDGSVKSRKIGARNVADIFN
jgi:thiol-disulfide isomerase/thioredoxin